MTTQWTAPDTEAGPDTAGVPLLITRPVDQSQSFALAATRRFGSRISPILSPIQQTEFTGVQLPTGPYTAVIFTSMRAVSAVERMDHSLPRRAICVGKATAERARQAGFDAVSVDGASDAVVGYFVRQNEGGQLLHLRGEVSRGAVATRLTSLGVPTDEVVVYRQFPAPLSAAATDVLRRKGPVIVPLFSPRTAQLFGERLPDGLAADLWLAPMSAAVAGAGAAIPARHVMIATRPDAESVLDAIGKLLDRIATR